MPNVIEKSKRAQATLIPDCAGAGAWLESIPARQCLTESMVALLARAQRSRVERSPADSGMTEPQISEKKRGRSRKRKILYLSFSALMMKQKKNNLCLQMGSTVT